MVESFPRQYARTRRFTLGVPRAFQVSPDGARVAFLRGRGGDDPVTCLWTMDVATGAERLVADPVAIAGAAEELSPEERARRERAREVAGGVVSYATDRALRGAVFTLSGRVYLADLVGGGRVRALPAAAPAFDPRLSPGGERVSYVHGAALRVVGTGGGGGNGDGDGDGDGDTVLVAPEAEHVGYGLAEFVAAEEMGRMRGHWWAPDGSALLVARVDETEVTRWHIADPANPDRPPAETPYPAAGTANAAVSLAVRRLDGTVTPLDWTEEFCYLAAVRWADGGLLLLVQTRDQRRSRVLEADPGTGATRVVREDHDSAWLDLVPGVPDRTASGALVWVAARDGAYRLLIDDEPVTPPDLQVRSVRSVDGDTVLFTASELPTETHLWTLGPDGLRRLTEGAGVYGGTRAGGTTVIAGSALDRDGIAAWVRRADGGSVPVTGHAERPVIGPPRVELLRAGAAGIHTAVLFPTDHRPGSGRLPVLLDPYGGPGEGAQRVVAARGAYLTSQWFADQGFAVVIADGRGTAGRGPDWARAIHRDFATAPLEDQVEALHAAAERYPDLDLERVGIRGWSFGGYLAALAVLRRPDVFHAAVAGAPVTDWRLYDTHYTERYLGHPGDDPDTYERSSLLADAARLDRPLLLIHGLADDNVVAAHTLRLSSALLAAGRAHSVLPLSGVTHMTPQETVAENLLLLQARFLREALAGRPG